jgi:xanthine dehydrogenase accessory factor
MDDLTVHEALIAAARGGRPAALATVIRTRGSVPRHAGSRMLIDLETGPVGTIGGGCGEADVVAAARAVVATGSARVVRVELMDRIDSWSPAVCGGVMEVFVERVVPAGGAA